LVYVKALTLNQHHIGVGVIYPQPTSHPCFASTTLIKEFETASKRNDLLPIYSLMLELMAFKRKMGAVCW